jgi:hypothetical protein
MPVLHKAPTVARNFHSNNLQDLKYRKLFCLIVCLVLTFIKIQAIAQKPCYVYPDAMYKASIQKGTISLSDSILFIAGSIQADYRVIGFANPDTCSKRLIVFSVFTRDVDGNPYGCQYGSYYSTQSIDSVLIKYTGKVKGFIQASVIVNGLKKTSVYFESRWIRFTKY